ncbi:histidine phosphatase family protein [Microbacterium sp. BWT-B31]|uniref:histidine phosphatase family protein n=1 Tax=Microbacterium sp. BWT-B31 TaxID=3232072 RepID=UPI003527C905
MTSLTLIRHGETDWNRAGRIQGTTDIPLNDTGRQQARDAAAALRLSLSDSAPVVVVSSDLSRARETAQIIAAELGVVAERTYPALRERAYGEAEGLAVDEFRARYGPWHSAEVPGAETWSDLRTRALRGIRTAVRDVRRATAPASASLVIVAHGALIREVLRHVTGGVAPLDGERLPNGGAYGMLYERERLSLRSYAGAPAS